MELNSENMECGGWSQYAMSATRCLGVKLRFKSNLVLQGTKISMRIFQPESVSWGTKNMGAVLKKS